MGMSTSIIGFVSDQDETYQQHKRVYDACIAAGVTIPNETADYFGDLDSWDTEDHLKREIPKHEWSEDMSSGYEIIVSEIPKGVHKIRFYNSW